MAGRVFFLAPFCGEYGNETKDIISRRSLTSIVSPVFNPTGGVNYDGYLETAVNTKLKLSKVDNTFTIGAESHCIEAWVKITTPLTNQSRYIFRLASDVSPSYSQGIMFGVNPSLSLYAAAGTGGSDISISKGGALPPIDTWFHIAASYNHITKALRLFYNGELVATATVPAINAISGDPTIYIAHDPGNSARDWVGGIQDVCLTVGSVKYTETFIPPTRLALDFNGTVVRDDGMEPAPIVLVRSTSNLITEPVTPNSIGKWGLLVSKGSYDISYIADGLKPEIHGPYIA